MITFDQLQRQAISVFDAKFERRPAVIGIAPGRVELLGNHTDHNLGLVLSAAIDRHTCVAAAPNDSPRVRVWSTNLRAFDEFSIPGPTPLSRGAWSNYVRGTVSALIDAGVAVSGFDAVVASDVPLGGGLSSSASLECAVAMAVLGMFGGGPGRQTEAVRPQKTSDRPDGGCDPRGGRLESGARSAPYAGQPERMQLALLLKQAEHRFAGVQCGVLDQFSSLFGRSGHALFLDCESLAHEVAPLGPNAPAIVVCDSRTPRELADGKYNERRAECAAALESLREMLPRVVVGPCRSLRDVPLDSFLACRAGMKPVLARRVRHVLTENQRVRTGADLLRSAGDVQSLGRLMLESHQSSRDDFENSSPELDCLIEIAAGLPGFLGGKLSGAGWGGCTVNLVEPARAESFAKRLTDEYGRRRSLPASVMICHAADGARFERFVD